MVVLYILLFILILGLVVCFHEFGHFFFARKAGILVNEFAFGMGPKLWSKKKGETYYSIRAFPIGGFCAMAGEEASNPPIKENDEVKLVFNKEGKVLKIILKTDDPRFADLPVTKVEKADLYGKNMAPLYINDFEVLRDATLVISKKDEMQIAPEERNFSSKTVWQRLLVSFGGPLNNIILALVVFMVMSFIVGVAKSDSSVVGAITEDSPSYSLLEEGDEITNIGDYSISTFEDISVAIYGTKNRTLPITFLRDGESFTINIEAYYAFNSLGISSEEGSGEVVSIICETEAALGGTNKTKAYQEGGLKNGDIITGIIYNGTTYEINSWDELYSLVTDTIDGGNVTILYERDNENLTSNPYEVYSNELLSSQGYASAYKQIGISAERTVKFFPCLLNGLKYFWSSATIIFSTLGLLITSKEVGVSDLGGFITILNQTATYASGGFTSLLYFVGLLSVNLAILNLLPIPALDGGRILFILVEGVTGKKVNPKVETIIENIVFWLLMAFIGYVLIQDVFRLVIQLQ